MGIVLKKVSYRSYTDIIKRNKILVNQAIKLRSLASLNVISFGDNKLGIKHEGLEQWV